MVISGERRETSMYHTGIAASVAYPKGRFLNVTNLDLKEYPLQI